MLHSFRKALREKKVVTNPLTLKADLSSTHDVLKKKTCEVNCALNLPLDLKWQIWLWFMANYVAENRLWLCILHVWTRWTPLIRVFVDKIEVKFAVFYSWPLLVHNLSTLYAKASSAAINSLSLMDFSVVRESWSSFSHPKGEFVRDSGSENKDNVCEGKRLISK